GGGRPAVAVGRPLSRARRCDRAAPFGRLTRCGKTQFEVGEPPPRVKRCTCSICSKRGALWAYYKPAQFHLITPPEDIATYLWGSKTVKHHFCANCGCGTFSESPDWST